MIILDTNILIEIERGNNKIKNTLSEIRKEHPESIAITSPVYAEFLYGFIRKGKEQIAKQYIENLEVFDFDSRSAETLAKLKYEIEQKGSTIPIFDLLTASIVITRRATFLTMDSHFKSVPGIELILI